MSDNEDMKELRELQEKLQAEKTAIEEAAAPYRARYTELNEQMAPMVAEQRECAKKFKEIEGTRLAELHNMLGRLAISLGGKRLSLGDPNIEVPKED